MYEMNETASAIIEQLSRAPASADELSQALEREYDGSPEEIKDDVQHLLADFADAGLVRSTDRK
jgi:PqqD family protein of HPr-rel-A system